jgi:hypothetical protein
VYPSPTAIRGGDVLSRRKRCDAAECGSWRAHAARGARRTIGRSTQHAARAHGTARAREFSHRTAEPDSTSWLNGPIRSDAGNSRGSPLCNDLDSKHFVFRVPSAFLVAASLALSPRLCTRASHSSAEAWLVAARFRALRREFHRHFHQPTQVTVQRSRCLRAARLAPPRRRCRRLRPRAAVLMKTRAGERLRRARHSRCRAAAPLPADAQASSPRATATPVA